MTAVRITQITLEIWGAVFTFISAMTAISSAKYEKRRGRLLVYMLLITSTLLIFDAIAWYYNGNTTPTGYYMVRISNFVVFANIAILEAFVIMYIVELLEFNGVSVPRRWLTASMSVSGLQFAVIVVSQFTNLLYHFDENNVYARNSGFFIVSVLAAIVMCIMFALIILNRKSIPRYEFFALISYILLPFVANVFQTFHYGISLNNIAVTLSVLLVFLSHEVEKSRRIARQNELLTENEIAIMQQKAELYQKNLELAESRARISVSQMQPHFVFNALGSIEQLCKMDPERAAAATHHFSQYLRTNIHALSTAELVPFAEELKHVRTYVWLEQMRFGDDVKFVEDIGCDKFSLPMLSVQPLVENAIKHGMMATYDVLEVVLHTEETEKEYLISIKDNGGGFDTEAKFVDNYSHIGLNSVKERIGLMTGGIVKVRSVLGEGTEVTICIPKEKTDAALKTSDK